jgi:hypothetical protein
MKLNKPFSVAPSPLAPPSFLTLANPVYPTQDFSSPGQHNSGTRSSQGVQDVQELPQENSQKPSKRPNKMRVSKHSTTPRYVVYTTNIFLQWNIDIFQGTSVRKNGLSSITVRWRSLPRIFRPFLQRS